ncbi:MAG: amidohydrolase family protein [Spirochaetaceae bacterium]|jgi:guanine deaminase|nr:amidohydrolase family protein [Spirochaetaceae bacterium]
MTMKETLILKGNIIHCPTPREFEIHENSYIISRKGKVLGIYPELPGDYKGIDSKLPEDLQNIEFHDFGQALIIPSFIDLHIHASQYMQRGLGLDMQLIPWLEQYTFPHEKLFAQEEYARRIYPHFAESLHSVGSLRSCIFGTIHQESNEILMQSLMDRGLIAYVGKVNMDCNAPDYLCENTGQSLKETRAFIKEFQNNPRVKPIITPRFAPSCTSELMRGLADLAEEFDVPIQSHISENPEELQWVKELFPHCDSYSEVYRNHGLWNSQTLMAHGVYLTEQGKEWMRQAGVQVVHCPEANLNLTSGIMPLTDMLDAGLIIGLGSDVGAGQSMAINRVMVRAIQSSKILHKFTPQSRVLSLSEAFYLGTKANGRLWGKVGSFEPEYSMDALVIQDELADREGFSPLEKLQRFIYCGDDRNIAARYLEGRRI